MLFPSFLELNQNILRMIVSEIEGHSVFVMYSSSNLPTLEKCCYINGMSPHLGQASAN
jgi:hypothetical protein